MNLRLLISMIGSHFPCTYIPVTSARHDSGLRGGEVDRGERTSPGAAAPNFRQPSKSSFYSQTFYGQFCGLFGRADRKRHRSGFHHAADRAVSAPEH